MIDRFPCLGVDPAPGDADVLDALARTTGRLASHLRAVAGELDTVADVGACWSGSAADEFRDAVRRLPRSLRDTGQAFSSASVALSRWSRLLADLQVEARRAEQDAESATARLRAASSDSPLAGLAGPEAPWVSTVGPVDAAHVRRVLGPYAEAEQALEAARERGRLIAARATAGADAAASAVRAATQLAPPVPHCFRQLLDGAGRFDEWLGGHVREHAVLLSKLADTLTVLGFATLVFAFPGGLVLAGAGLLATSLLVRYAGGAPSDVAMSALGVATGGLSKVAGLMVKGGRAEDVLATADVPPPLWGPAQAGGRAGWQVTELSSQVAEVSLSALGVSGLVERRSMPDRPVPSRLQLVSAGSGTPERGTSAAPRRPPVHGPPATPSWRPTDLPLSQGAPLSATTLSGPGLSAATLVPARERPVAGPTAGAGPEHRPRPRAVP